MQGLYIQYLAKILQNILFITLYAFVHIIFICSSKDRSLRIKTSKSFATTLHCTSTPLKKILKIKIF